MVPLPVVPHAFGLEEHVLPYPAGFAGVTASQEPFTTEPEVVEPQEFGAEVQDCGGFTVTVAEALRLAQV